MKFCLVDTIGSGHHWTYNKLIIDALIEKTDNQVIYRTGDKLEVDQRNYLVEHGVTISVFDYRDTTFSNSYKLFLYRIKKLNQLLDFCKNNQVEKLLFLYADGLMAALMVTRFWQIPGIFYFVHWFPVKKMDRLLFSFAKSKKVFVHTEFIQNALPAPLKRKAVVLPYPMVPIDREALQVSVAPQNHILYFGGTRKDKGIDLFLKALKLIKSKVFVTICGAESYFKEDYIRNELRECLNVEGNKVMLRYVSDEEMEQEYANAGIVILPYRKTFRGESGVLLEAINHQKLVIAPDILHFREYIEEAGCGILYPAEDIERMAEAIDNAVNNYDALYDNRGCRNFAEKHSVERFKTMVRDNIN